MVKQGLSNMNRQTNGLHSMDGKYTQIYRAIFRFLMEEIQDYIILKKAKRKQPNIPIEYLQALHSPQSTTVLTLD
jgi:hypothetical protein